MLRFLTYMCAASMIKHVASALPTHAFSSRSKPVKTQGLRSFRAKSSKKRLLRSMEAEAMTQLSVDLDLSSRAPTEHNGTSVRIAVLVVGLVRSFRFRMVAESLKDNLLEVLVKNGSTVDTFLRLSLHDAAEVDGGYRRHLSSGLETVGEKELESEVFAQVQQNAELLSPVSTAWYNAGSHDEEVEEANVLPSIQHRAARVASPRLYAQIFERFMAYRGAKEHEKKTGVHYEWFISTRPDCLLFGPMPTVSFLSRGKIWVNAHWNWAVPDVLMYVPASKSDVFFSVDVLTEPEHCCYSAKDGHHIWTLPDPSSELAKYEPELQRLVQQGRCPDKLSAGQISCGGGEAAVYANAIKHKIDNDITFYPLSLTLGHIGNGNSILDECYRVERRMSMFGIRFVLSVAELVSCREMVSHHDACIARSDTVCSAPVRPNGKHDFVPFVVKSFGGNCLGNSGKSLKPQTCAKIYYKPDERDLADSYGYHAVSQQSFFPMSIGKNQWLLKLAASRLCLNASSEPASCNQKDLAQQWSLKQMETDEGEVYVMSIESTKGMNEALRLVALPLTPICNLDRFAMPECG